jgi:uncharacterized membrane protein SirB2
MLSSLWWIPPFMSLVVGVILVSQGLWRLQHDSAKRREVSKATIVRSSAVLFSSGVGLLIISAVLLLGVAKL